MFARSAAELLDVGLGVGPIHTDDGGEGPGLRHVLQAIDSDRLPLSSFWAAAVNHACLPLRECHFETSRREMSRDAYLVSGSEPAGLVAGLAAHHVRPGGNHYHFRTLRAFSKRGSR